METEYKNYISVIILIQSILLPLSVSAEEWQFRNTDSIKFRLTDRLGGSAETELHTAAGSFETGYVHSDAGITKRAGPCLKYGLKNNGSIQEFQGQDIRMDKGLLF